MKYGFENHETFSRNFKEAYGMTPTEYRNNPVVLSHFNKPDISLKYNIIDEDVPVVTDGVVLEVTRIVLDQPKHFVGFIDNGEIKAPAVDPFMNVWTKLHQLKESFEGYTPNGNEIGVNLNMAEGKTEMKYFAGAEVKEESKNVDFERYTVNPGKYIVCKFEAEDFETLITETISKIYNYMFVWIENKKLFSEVEPVAIEMYDKSLHNEAYMELWIPLK